MSKKKAQRPKELTQLPPAVSPPNPAPVVVATFYGDASDGAYVTCPMRLVQIWLNEVPEEEYETENGRFFEVDGEVVFIYDQNLVPGVTIPTIVRNALKAAGIDIPGLSAAADGSEATSE